MNPSPSSSLENSDPATLDPPGTIAVLGTTPIGIEAALYGRFLGYNVTLLAAADVWQPRDFVDQKLQRIGPTFCDDWFATEWLKSQNLADLWDSPAPMMPDRCLSSLAFSAIEAQTEAAPRPLPITMRQWIEDGLTDVIQTDLLRNRVHPSTFVRSIELVPIDDEGELDADERNPEPNDEDLPPDFLLNLDGEPISDEDGAVLQCECVIVAGISKAYWQMSFDLPTDYFFEIGDSDEPAPTDAAEMLRRGWQQIASVYAQLAGRESLDLYRPARL